jgi:two-component system, cell cycle response regulator
MVPSGDEFEKTSIVMSDTFKGRMKAADEAPPALVVLMGPTGYVGKQFPLTQAESIIGRSVECQIFIDDKSVSRSHARLNVAGTEVVLMDMGSSNKTIINGKTLQEMTPYRLSNNDQIKTGNVIFKFLESGNLEAITNKELNDKAEKDALTGAYSKGALLEKGPEAIKRSEFLVEELSVLVFDIDFFKKVNDNYGHAAGDYVLKTLANIVGTKMTRAVDYFARYGGEEFVILLQGTPIKTALEVAERIRTTIESTVFEFEGKTIPVTISLGVASRVYSESSWEQLFKRADEALYKSKQSGRNRVTAAN